MVDHRPVPLGGRRHAGDEHTPVRAPFDGAPVATVPRCGPAEVDEAVAAAKAALDAGDLPQWRRAEILDAAAVGLAERRDSFARTLALEAAKPITTARVEVDRAVSTFRFAATACRTLAGEVVPMEASAAGEGKLALTLRVPVGVVGAISPFNFPLNLVAHKVAPAIAAGCPVVLKPASQTPLSAIGLADLLLDGCGLPPGWLSVVTGSGAEVGDPLVAHDDVALVTFTGSPGVGWSIREKAPRKEVALELGNNSPVILEPSGDWEAAVAKVRTGGFSHAGQSCISVQRILAHRSIADRVVDALAEAVRSLVVGDPLDEATEVSALISASECRRVGEWVDEAVAVGATAVVGGSALDERSYRPTVLRDVRPDMRVMADEVFGPVVSVLAYDDLDEALRLANDTRYGLQAAIFTADVTDALHAARTLDFGGVLVNEIPTFRADQQPYGGHRDSGNTKEGPLWAVRSMTRERLVVFS